MPGAHHHIPLTEAVIGDRSREDQIQPFEANCWTKGFQGPLIWSGGLPELPGLSPQIQGHLIGLKGLQEFPDSQNQGPSSRSAEADIHFISQYRFQGPLYLILLEVSGYPKNLTSKAHLIENICLLGVSVSLLGAQLIRFAVLSFCQEDGRQQGETPSYVSRNKRFFVWYNGGIDKELYLSRNCFNR